ncbi:DUF6440 family protein [Halobacillus sp. ACCC02827]|uniref:DUF6440 family protein n=1 Tax=Bacillaceae TaxID=186817 RepID=UPI0004266B86|nr:MULTISPECIES: DUF6440 family protein [Bacillaceae]WJE17143.1 DUF6440 family protein [Halobacillus sp. ACCC02827]
MMFHKKEKKENKRFDEKLIQTSQQGSMISIWVDRETGVNYIYTWSAQGCTLTPLLDKNGEVIVAQIEEDK